MTDYSELVKALRHCSGLLGCTECPRYDAEKARKYFGCGALEDAADAIEALQAEVQSYKALADEWKASAENKERLLGLYRAEQRNVYSAMDDNGRIIKNLCACLNIPVFPDSSESPNS